VEALPYLTDQPVRSFERPERVVDLEAFEYFAEIETNKGVIEIELLGKSAPTTVNAFVFLALHRFFDGLTWHRVVPGFVVQSGDPTGTGAGTAGYAFGLEIDPRLAYDDAGWVGMARTEDPNSNSSQFFITLGPAPHLTGHYTIFGRVRTGREALFALEQGDRIISVRIYRSARRASP